MSITDNRINENKLNVLLKLYITHFQTESKGKEAQEDGATGEVWADEGNKSYEFYNS